MAEFQEVMKQWRRMCEKNQPDCMRLCPICANPACGELSNASDEYIRKAEDAIMQWAAEHPEPVYPTWREYLQEQGILDVEYIPAASSTTSTSKSYVQTVKTLAPFYRPIPADIAQKLGIEPKEGT